MSAGRGYSGKYKVNDRVTTQVINWTTGETPEKKTPFIRVNLHGGITWTGWCSSEKAIEITIKALTVMGFKGTDLGQIKMADALDTERDVVAVIGEIRKWKDQTFYDAKFINRAAKKGYKAESKDEAVLDKLKDIDTRSVIESAENEDPGPGDNDGPIGHHPIFDQNFTAEDIPF